MKITPRIILAGVTAVVMVALALFLGFLWLRNGAHTPLPPQIALPTPNPIRVAIASPADGGTFPLNGSVPVVVTLASELPLQGIRYWLDGLEIGAVPSASPAISVEFRFPASLLSGGAWHTLYAAAVDQIGRVALTNAVHIKASSPVGMETIYISTPGDSLQFVAARFQVDMATLQARNPAWRGADGDPLPPGSGVIIPIGSSPSLPPTEPASPATPPQFGSSLPKPPTVVLRADQCVITAALQDLAADAEGFVLYRLNAQASQFAPVASFKGDQQGPLTYLDTSAFGTVQYVASAYADQGESLGNPAEISLTAPGCANPSTLIVSGNFLSLPPSPNGTYFYWATQGNGYERYPASNAEFLTLDNGAFDLRSLTGGQAAGADQLGVALEAWRWNAGQLSLLGSVQARVQTDSELRICPTGTICGGDGGIPYAQYAMVGSDQESQVRKFKWNVTSPLAPSYTAVLFQMSLQPFPAGIQDSIPGLAFAKVVPGESSSEGSLSGAFSLDFKALGEYFASEGSALANLSQLVVQGSGSPALVSPWMVSLYEEDNPERSGLLSLVNQDAQANGHSPNASLTFYARVVPLLNGKLTASPSNVVTIDYRPTGTNQIPVIGQAPSIYAIDILASAAPIPPTAHWGCVDILAVNPNSWVWTSPGPFQGQLQAFQALLQNQQPYCPQVWQAPDQTWYDDLWDWVNEGLDVLNDFYQAAKQLSVDSMLAQYDLIGGWELCPVPDCRDKVRAGLMQGQEWVLKYQYGVPADLPDLNELTEDGIDALAEQGLKYAGLDGDACPPQVLDCKQILADSIRTLRDEFIRQSVAASQDDAIAHSHGFYALLLPTDPSAISVRPAKTLHWQMAEAVVRVTRTPGASNLTEEQLRNLAFTLQAEVYAVNEACRNRTHSFCVDQVTVNGAPGQCHEQSVVLPDEPCQGVLFGGSRPIPLLAPGESADFTVKLNPRPYWSPSMPEEYKAYNPGGDFDLLYYGAEAEITAHILPNAYMAEASDGPDPFLLAILNTSGLLGGY